MVVYSLSPGAYKGLLELASDSRWCIDYDRIHRYLDVVVSANEAVRIPSEPKALNDPRIGWTHFSFLEPTESISLRKVART